MALSWKALALIVVESLRPIKRSLHLTTQELADYRRHFRANDADIEQQGSPGTLEPPASCLSLG